MAEGSAQIPQPQPRPRAARTPVPLPRVSLATPRVPERKESAETKLQHSKSFNNTSSLKKSLKRVRSNVQEKSNAVFESTRNSVRNILPKRQSASDVLGLKESDKVNVEDDKRSHSLPPDDLFHSIKFGSPLVSEDIYEENDITSVPPPSYPPPPLPDESYYDHVQSARSSVCISPTTVPERPYYEEVPVFKKSSNEDSSEVSSSCGAASLQEPGLEKTTRSNSWNFYESAQGSNLFKVPGPLYENVAVDDCYTLKSENIYSDEPNSHGVVENSKVKVTILPDEIDGAVSMKLRPHEYENCLVTMPCILSGGSSIDSDEISQKASAMDKTVIYEFDPLFEERKKQKAEAERKLKDENKVKDEAELDLDVDIYNIPTPPQRVDSLKEIEEQSVPNDVEYFLYHRVAGENNFLVVNEVPRGASCQKEGSKLSNLVQWTNVKKVLNKMVPDSAPWTPGLSRKNSRAKEVSQKLMLSQSPHHGFILRSLSNGDKPKDFSQKWCQLGEGKLTLAQDKTSASKEVISLENILSIHNLLDPKICSNDDNAVHCWEVSVSGKSKPYVFGASSSADSKMWMRKLLESLTNVFPMKLSAEFCRAGQCFLREGITDDWTGAWILLAKRVLYYCQMKERMKEVDLRKTRLVALQTDDGSCKLVSEQGAYIQVHTVDKVLYLQMDNVRETKAWRQAIRMAAMENGPGLYEQQLTKDDVPVVVDKCLSFVYAHGSMSEGIYRRSGGNSNVTRLTAEMRSDAWAVQLSRQEYTEHDVASVLKRFFHELSDTLLTSLLHKYFCKAGSSKCSKNEKIGMYRTILEKLPRINYVTARRLFGHFSFIAEQANLNKMPSENLAAIWAPTLMGMEGKRGVEWRKKECEVIKDLIENYKAVFLVDCEEIDREQRILSVLRMVQKTSTNLPPPKPSGDLKISIFLRSKHGESVSVVVGPGLKAGQICSMLAPRTEYASHELCLHEMVLGGALSRPIHHSEKVLDIALKWAYWDATDCRENYFLLALNSVYREIMPLAHTPMSKCGDLKFADQKTKSFKTFTFEFSKAKLKYYKDKACSIKINEWRIEDITWYIGHELKRNPQTRWAITFIYKNDEVKRSKDRPFFGNTIAGSSKEEQLQWMSALILGQYQYTDLIPKANLI